MAQPEYDFFSRPGAGEDGPASGDPRFGRTAAAGRPGPATNQFAPGGLLGSTPAGRFGGPTGSAFAPQPTHEPAPANDWARAGRSRVRVPRWLVALVAGLVGLVVLGVVAVVALPVFLAQRDKASYQATRIVLPSSVEGLPRNPALSVAAGVKQVRQDAGQAMPGLFTVSGSGYGSAGAGRAALVVVAHARRALTADEQATLRHGTIAQMTRQGERVTAEPAGRLGGSFDCLVRGTSTTCLALDPAGLIKITVGHGDRRTQVETARRIREAVELRA